MSERLGKLLYGALFAALLPALLVLWARAAAPNISLPAVASPIGWGVAAAGLALLLWAIAALAVWGRGLPMNAYPPPMLVTRGPYGLVAHPIYLGFALVCAGCAVGAGSAAGLWLVTPVVALGAGALVLGYEGPDLDARFGQRPRPFLRLPADGAGRPSAADRLSAFALVLVPWVVLYEAVQALGVAPDAVALMLPGEAGWPVWEGTELVYASTYLFVALAPLAAATRGDLHRFMLRGWAATALVVFLWLVLPVAAPPRPFHPQGPFGALLALERRFDSPACAFPSFHVVWAFLAAPVWAGRLRRAPALAWAWATSIALSCVTTGMHTAADVAGGLVAALLVLRLPAVWEALRAGAERLANSWREWDFGAVRIINHGGWAALGTLVGVGLAGSLVGSRHVPSVLLVAFVGLAGAGLWAQFVEGSPSLLRPFGYYGGVLGVVAGAFSRASPSGRMRGCCSRRTPSRRRGSRRWDACDASCRAAATARRAACDGDPLPPPALARVPPLGPRGRPRSSDTPLLDPLERRAGADRRAALGGARAAARDRRRLPDPHGSRPLRRGVPPRRAPDARLRAAAPLPVDGRGHGRGRCGGHVRDRGPARAVGQALVRRARGRPRLRRRDVVRARRRLSALEPEVRAARLRKETAMPGGTPVKGAVLLLAAVLALPAAAQEPRKAPPPPEPVPTSWEVTLGGAGGFGVSSSDMDAAFGAAGYVPSSSGDFLSTTFFPAVRFSLGERAAVGLSFSSTKIGSTTGSGFGTTVFIQRSSMDARARRVLAAVSRRPRRRGPGLVPADGVARRRDGSHRLEDRMDRRGGARLPRGRPMVRRPRRPVPRDRGRRFRNVRAARDGAGRASAGLPRRHRVRARRVPGGNRVSVLSRSAPGLVPTAP